MDEIRCAIELRADDSRESPGRIVGTLVTYGERASDRPELFEAGSLTWPDGGVVLNRQHTRTAPVVRFAPTVEGSKVGIDQKLPDSSAGRDAAVEIRAGLFTGLSLEFRAVTQSFSGGIRRISKAILTGAALVDSPSYAGSAVEVRAGSDIRTDRAGRRRVWL